jgi:hypothetical protein
MDDVAFYLVDGIYLDEFGEWGEEADAETRHPRECRGGLARPLR